MLIKATTKKGDAMFILIFFIFAILAMEKNMYQPLTEFDETEQISYRVSDLSHALLLACIKQKPIALRKAYHLWMERILMDADFLSKTSIKRLKIYMDAHIMQIQSTCGDLAFSDNEQYKKDQLKALKTLKTAIRFDHCDDTLWINEFKKKRSGDGTSVSIKEKRLARLKQRKRAEIVNEYRATKLRLREQEDATLSYCTII